MVKIFVDKIKYLTFANILISIIFLLAILFRLSMFGQVGRDNITFVETVVSLSSGENPYLKTLRSFEDSDKTSGGYAYFPGLMYTYYILYLFSGFLGISYVFLWKIPVLLADIGVGVLLYKLLRNEKLAVVILALIIWFFNPYLITNLKYQYNDSIPVFLLFLSLYYLHKDSVASGALYALSIIFKTFPIFIFPAVMVNNKKKIIFLVAGTIVAIAISMPFMRSINDFMVYIKGSVFVHEGREVTGRPFLFYISYFYKVEFIRMIPIYVYTYIATFLPWVTILVSRYLLKIKDEYVLITMGLISFLVFTPVLNRTYIIWLLPFYIVASARISKNKNIYYFLTAFLYIFYSWYLYQWIDGFQTTIPQV